MIGWFKHLKERWDAWSGDADMDQAIREQLTNAGYFGRTASLASLRLVAVQRPGWLQVFRFEASARLQPTLDEEQPDPDAEYHQLFGLVREDHRKDLCEIEVFLTEPERQDRFSQWSDGLICLRGAKGLIDPTA